MASNYADVEENADKHHAANDKRQHLCCWPEGVTVIPEWEIVHESEDRIDLLKKRYDNKCSKNPDHKEFYSVHNYLDHVPEKLRTQENMDNIQRKINRTVRVRAAYTSNHRPDFFHDNKGEYPFLKYKGSKTSIRYGTGTIYKSPLSIPIEGMLCPCHLCAKSKNPEKDYRFYSVITATHVVFDDSEAACTTVECFFDADDKRTGVKKLYALRLNRSNFAGDMYPSDFCELECVTHDFETIDKIAQLCFPPVGPSFDFSYFTNSALPPEGVIVSHPHGCGKRITFGSVLHLTVPVKPEFKTNTPIDLPYGTSCSVPLNVNTLATKNGRESTADSKGNESPSPQKTMNVVEDKAEKAYSETEGRGNSDKGHCGDIRNDTNSKNSGVSDNRADCNPCKNQKGEGTSSRKEKDNARFHTHGVDEPVKSSISVTSLLSEVDADVLENINIYLNRMRGVSQNTQVFPPTDDDRQINDTVAFFQNLMRSLNDQIECSPQSRTEEQVKSKQKSTGDTEKDEYMETIQIPNRSDLTNNGADSNTHPGKNTRVFNEDKVKVEEAESSSKSKAVKTSASSMPSPLDEDRLKKIYIHLRKMMANPPFNSLSSPFGKSGKKTEVLIENLTKLLQEQNDWGLQDSNIRDDILSPIFSQLPGILQHINESNSNSTISPSRNQSPWDNITTSLLEFGIKQRGSQEGEEKMNYCKQLFKANKSDFVKSLTSVYEELFRRGFQTVPAPSPIEDIKFSSGKTFTFPPETKFTLPKDASYAMRYYAGKPGKFRFYPGAVLTLPNGTTLEVPDEAEFENSAFIPHVSYLSHRISTCGGSSGASVYCDLLNFKLMTMFPHSGHFEDGEKTNVSGKPENIDFKQFFVMPSLSGDSNSSSSRSRQSNVGGLLGTFFWKKSVDLTNIYK